MAILEACVESRDTLLPPQGKRKWGNLHTGDIKHGGRKTGHRGDHMYATSISRL